MNDHTRTTPHDAAGRDGTLTTVDGQVALRFERRLPHDVDRVWRAVSEPDQLGRWMPAAVPWTPREGESFDLGGIVLAVTEVEEARRLAWTVGADRYVIELTADPDGDEVGCVLVFVHVLGQELPLAQTATGWHTYLARLDALLAGAELSEQEAHRGWGEVHERYAAAFGVDPEPGRAFAASLPQD